MASPAVAWKIVLSKNRAASRDTASPGSSRPTARFATGRPVRDHPRRSSPRNVRRDVSHAWSAARSSSYSAVFVSNTSLAEPVVAPLRPRIPPPLCVSRLDRATLRCRTCHVLGNLSPDLGIQGVASQHDVPPESPLMRDRSPPGNRPHPYRRQRGHGTDQFPPLPHGTNRGESLPPPPSPSTAGTPSLVGHSG